MSIATSGIPQSHLGEYTTSPASARASDAGPKPLHRIAEVRQQQGVSLRTAARHMSKDMPTVRHQEKSTTDLRLSELVAWQQVLDVPLIDLLVDSGAPLSRPVMERARLVRLMKTAAAIREKCESIELRRLANTLIAQLTEIMPELADISAWHSVGQRRSLDEVGRVAERRLRDDFFVVYRED